MLCACAVRIIVILFSAKYVYSVGMECTSVALLNYNLYGQSVLLEMIR